MDETIVESGQVFQEAENSLREEDSITIAGEVIETPKESNPVATKMEEEKVYHYDEIPHGISLVKINPKFSLGGESKIGITRSTKKDSKKVRKAKAKMSHRNNRKNRHHATKLERRARRLWIKIFLYF